MPRSILYFFVLSQFPGDSDGIIHHDIFGLDVQIHALLCSAVRRVVPICSSSCAEWRRLKRKFDKGDADALLSSDGMLRPCFDAHVGLGPGVCCGNVTPEEYAENVRRVARFLDGRHDEFVDELTAEMMEAAEITGNKHIFIRLSHTPHPLLRSTLQQFYESHPDYLVQNIRNRFRSKEHFRSDELCYMQLWNEGRLHLRPVRPVLMRYYHRKGMMQLEWTLRRVTKPGSTVCFACFYALDQVTDKIFARITQFVEELLDGQR